MITALRIYVDDAWEAWNDFWFAPANPATLSAIRVLAGAMLLYTHFVWSFDLMGFFGPDGWLPTDLVHEVHESMNDPDGLGLTAVKPPLMWSHFDIIQSPKLIWTVHITALVIYFLLTIGFFSRTMAVLGFLIAVSYAHRVTPGANFGLDKINCLLVLYLILGPCGARYSFDRLWRLRKGAPKEVPASSFANMAIRLIQVHMCIIYLFSALGKLQGRWWLTGDATWYSIATLEYQTMDMTWLLHHEWLVNFLTHLTVFWELTYAALVWPRFTRPWMLLVAVFIHGGIIFALGMPTFGLVMLIGNLAFISPQAVQKVFDPIARLVTLAVVGGEGQGGGAAPPRPANPSQQGIPQITTR
jgi:hypothetical protein